jgi:hypothetical protein
MVNTKKNQKMVEEIDFLVHFNRTLCISVPREDVSVENIKRAIEERENVPAQRLDLYLNGKKILDSMEILTCGSTMLRARMTGGLLGGKGGFGAMLRSMGKGSGAKATSDFGACRDLNGRRLRHVNQEVSMQKWREEATVREQRKKEGITDQEVMDEETSSGIAGWYLSVPSWAEGVKKSHLKRRRNTIMCKNWLDARAPPWWGCPRGKNCGFAHGEEELRGINLTEYKRQKKEEAYQKKQQALQKYVDYEQDIPDDIQAAIQQGIRNRKAKKQQEEKEALIKEVQILPPDATTYKKMTNITTIGDNWLLSFKKKEEDSPSVDITYQENIAIVRGTSNFGTAMVTGCKITQGKWYYEVVLLTAGVIQIGWADGSFEANSEAGDGVGDHPRSWAFDGCRQRKWTNENDEVYGDEPWEKGDIIASMLDLDANTISFSKNGQSLGIAFKNIKCQNTKGFFPAFSFEEKEQALINLGTKPLHHLEEGYLPVAQVLVSTSDQPLTSIQSNTNISSFTGSKQKKTPFKTPKLLEEKPKEIDFNQYKDVQALEKLGLDGLKEQLQIRGLKCG